MDRVLRQLLREYAQSRTNELAHQIAVTQLRTSSYDYSVNSVLPLCQYGNFLLSILSTYGSDDDPKCFRTDGGGDSGMAQINFRSKIDKDCVAIFDLEHDMGILWPLSLSEDQAAARNSFFAINIRDVARDIVYSYHVNDHTIHVDNELGSTGWGTQSNYITVLQNRGFETNAQQYHVEATLDLENVCERMSTTSAVEAMNTFKCIVSHLLDPRIP